MATIETTNELADQKIRALDEAILSEKYRGERVPATGAGTKAVLVNAALLNALKILIRVKILIIICL
jgi:hypothetical protein